MFLDFGAKCSHESRDSILEFFCTDGLLTSLGTSPYFYYIYEKYFSICYYDFANSMFSDWELQCVENVAMSPGTPFWKFFAQMGS
jgi:hypothetical protein